MQTENQTQSLIGEVELLRIQVAVSEAELNLLKVHAQRAGRRSKETKRIAQQAKRQFKHFKAHVSELKEALARMEPGSFKSTSARRRKKWRRVIRWQKSHSCFQKTAAPPVPSRRLGRIEAMP